jgi:pilus assembly protein Flp/PilA
MIKSVTSLLVSLRDEDSGATMVEYTILVALISVAAIATITLVGPKLVTMWGTVNTALP